MKTLKPIPATILTLSLSSALLSGCGVGEASLPDTDAIQAATPVPVETAMPFRSDINATYAASASISSDADAPVTARVAGEIVELLVEEGDRVEAGQVLARLDGERLRLEMLAARANLDRAKKEYERNTDLHERGLVSSAMFELSHHATSSREKILRLARSHFALPKHQSWSPTCRFLRQSWQSLQRATKQLSKWLPCPTTNSQRP